MSYTNNNICTQIKFQKGFSFIMKNNNTDLEKKQKTANAYDDGNIPHEDLPLDVIPDEVPRKDGPGGESGQ